MKYILLLLFPMILYAERNPWNEDYYNKKWCSEFGGISDKVLPSGREVDCLTENFAIETDWATRKSYEAIGQSMVYAYETEKIAGILLIIKDEKGIKWVNLTKSTLKYHKKDIPVWYIYAHERMEK